jgi:hypothetical protein
MKQQPEYQLQRAFARWLEIQHPYILFFSDAAAHVAKTAVQQIRANQLSKSGEKQPDMFIAHPANGFHGLFIEFKSETPFKVDGVTLKKNLHNEAQAKTLQRLMDAGYATSFAWSLEMAIEIFTRYKKGN